MTDVADLVAEELMTIGATVATAESLTGGSLASRLAAAPDSSEWFRGGIVAYASAVKHELLGVPPGAVVSAPSATAMATTTRRLLGADVAIALTGVGGPDCQDDQPPGTVFAALAVRDEVRCERWSIPGDPGEVVEATCDRAVRWLLAGIRASIPD